MLRRMLLKWPAYFDVTEVNLVKNLLLPVILQFLVVLVVVVVAASKDPVFAAAVAVAGAGCEHDAAVYWWVVVENQHETLDGFSGRKISQKQK